MIALPYGALGGVTDGAWLGPHHVWGPKSTHFRLSPSPYIITTVTQKPRTPLFQIPPMGLQGHPLPLPPPPPPQRAETKLP